MFRSSHQRNSRCKDFKVKRALQICVLLGVCIWMVYLVQHSRHKKTSYSEGTNVDSEIVKLGRKESHPNVEQSSIKDTRDKEEDEEENKHEKQNKTNNVNDNEESFMTNNESEENKHKTNKESDNVIKDNEDNKDKVKEDNQSREINEEKSEIEKQKTRETETGNKEVEEINQNKTESKEDEEENHKQEEKVESNVIENNDKERNNEKPKEKHYAPDNVSNVVGLNKTEQSNQKENNEFERSSEISGTQVAYLDQKERVLNVTKLKTTQKSFIVESGEQEHNKPSGDDVEIVHSQYGTNKTSNTTEEQFETSENPKVKDSSLHITMLKLKDSNLNATVEKVDSTITKSSGARESNVTNQEYDGKKNGNGGLVNASNSSILGEEDTSSHNNDDLMHVENEDIDTSETEDEAQNEPVEP
ncbi:hypothetical protein VNO78_08030 [Psophocarpus tetragonolobus]|uniref:Uncharacterized protein n=1 Tax=Psophocarpus tetragonolobus TaxID=3891 RepID=A0AAN9SUF0_PSOTE